MESEHRNSSQILIILTFHETSHYFTILMKCHNHGMPKYLTEVAMGPLKFLGGYCSKLVRISKLIPKIILVFRSHHLHWNLGATLTDHTSCTHTRLTRRVTTDLYEDVDVVPSFTSCLLYFMYLSEPCLYLILPVYNIQLAQYCQITVNNYVENTRRKS